MLERSTKIPFLNGPFSLRLIVPFPRVFSRSKFAVFNPLAGKFEKRREQLFRETTAWFSHLVVYFGPGWGSTNFLPGLISIICSQIIHRGWRPRRYFAWKSNSRFSGTKQPTLSLKRIFCITILWICMHIYGMRTISIKMHRMRIKYIKKSIYYKGYTMYSG